MCTLIVLDTASDASDSPKPSGRLLLLSTRSTVTFPSAEQHHSLVSIKLYCIVTEAHVCEQFAQSRCMIAERPGVKPLSIALTTAARSSVMTMKTCVINCTFGALQKHHVKQDAHAITPHNSRPFVQFRTLSPESRYRCLE